MCRYLYLHFSGILALLLMDLLSSSMCHSSYSTRKYRLHLLMNHYPSCNHRMTFELYHEMVVRICIQNLIQDFCMRCLLIPILLFHPFSTLLSSSCFLYRARWGKWECTRYLEGWALIFFWDLLVSGHDAVGLMSIWRIWRQIRRDWTFKEFIIPANFFLNFVLFLWTP